MRLVVVGGGPAGLAAARGYRAAGGTGRVTLLAAEGRLPYERPPLTKELLRAGGGEPPPIEEAEWFAAHAVDLVPKAAVGIDPVAREVALEGGGALPYDACVLATGSEPVRPPIPGAADPAVHVIRTPDHANRLAAATDAPGVRVAIVGSGFIGCEAAASLALRGVLVTLVAQESVPHAARLGAEAGGRITGWLEEHGVRLLTGATVSRIVRHRAGFAVETERGDRVEAGAVVLATGISPRAGLARSAGLEPTRSGRVPADERMRTAVEGIRVAGDLAAAHNAGAGRALDVEHWGEALNHGEIAGRSLAGDAEASWRTAPGFWSTIGEQTLKYVAWGDGFDTARLESHPAGAFTVRYGRDGVCVGVLTHGRDEDYEQGRALVESGAPLP